MKTFSDSSSPSCQCSFILPTWPSQPKRWIVSLFRQKHVGHFLKRITLFWRSSQQGRSMTVKVALAKHIALAQVWSLRWHLSPTNEQSCHQPQTPNGAHILNLLVWSHSSCTCTGKHIRRLRQTSVRLKLTSCVLSTPPLVTRHSAQCSDSQNFCEQGNVRCCVSCYGLFCERIKNCFHVPLI